jgi:AI-2 transport protein TqsA
MTFVSLAFWAWLLGPLGAILAIPLTLLAKALLVDTEPRVEWAEALLRSSPKELTDADRAALAEQRKARHRWRPGHRKPVAPPQPVNPAAT